MMNWVVSVIQIKADTYAQLEAEINNTLYWHSEWEPMNVIPTASSGLYWLTLRRQSDTSLIDPQDEATLESERERLS